jgi:hypothetical protein
MTTTTATQHLNVSPSDQTPPTTRRTGVSDLREGLRWAQSILDDPLATSVQASGMSAADLRAVERAASGNA